jgi:uncharacterized protein YbcI
MPGEHGIGVRAPTRLLPPYAGPKREEDENGKRMSVSPDTAQRGEVAAAISSAVVKLLREYTGRGPTKARTYIDENFISVVLEDTLTMGERSLVKDGRTELVLTTRKAFQDTMAEQLIAAVERHSGRSVRAFLSSNHIDPDIAIESFLLHRRNEDDPGVSRDDDSGEEGEG